MITGYTYELWNGKDAVGTYTSMTPLMGHFIQVPYLSSFKQKTNRKIQIVTCRIGIRKISDNGVDRTYRTFIDVRRKSMRQIEILKQGQKF